MKQILILTLWFMSFPSYGAGVTQSPSVTSASELTRLLTSQRRELWGLPVESTAIAIELLPSTATTLGFAVKAPPQFEHTLNLFMDAVRREDSAGVEHQLPGIPFLSGELFTYTFTRAHRAGQTDLVKTLVTRGGRISPCQTLKICELVSKDPTMLGLLTGHMMTNLTELDPTALNQLPTHYDALRDFMLQGLSDQIKLQFEGRLNTHRKRAAAFLAYYMVDLSAARDAAYRVAYRAAWDAAGDAAWAAARDAAWAALRPTVVELQESAHELVARLVAVTAE